MCELRRFQEDFGAALAGQPAARSGDALGRALAIHRNTAMKAAQDALAANYPVTLSLFGDEPFAACAMAFVTAAPPHDPSLSAYGAGFPDFLAAYPPAASAPYARDVAALERLCTEALFAADARALDGGDIDPSGHARLHPATRFESFSTPAVSIWRAVRGGDDAALGELDWAPEAALVTRPAGVVQVHPMAVGGLAFLAACAAGEPLSKAAQAAMTADARLTTLFADLINAGAFA